MERKPRCLALGTIVILIVTAFAAPFYAWCAVSEFIPHPFYGLAFARTTGEVYFAYRGQPGAAAHIVHGDRVVVDHGDIWRGLQLGERHTDPLRVATHHGIVTLHPVPDHVPIGSAILAAAVQITGLIVIAFATLLCLRRPGMMSFAFWLWAIMQPYDIMISIERFPPALGIFIILITSGFGFSGIPLISFALRFPEGRLRPQARWADILAWSVFAGGCIAFTGINVLWLDGYWADSAQATFIKNLTAIPMVIAGTMLLWRFARSNALDRAKTAWAITGFVGSIVAQIATQLVSAISFVSVAILTSFGFLPGLEARTLDVLANLFPLLAIYPILRYRLFDLGFAVNRAALYSILTLAAVGFFAGVNWLAQHFVTERLALVLQPIAAIVIGLAYARVRDGTQALLERTLFRERYAAEQRIDALIRTLPLAESPDAIDDALTREAVDALSLDCAAVVRSNAPVPPDIPLDTSIQIALESAANCIGTVYYGHHRNGTEIDPEEVALLRRLCEAAALAYQTAEMRAELHELRRAVAATA